MRRRLSIYLLVLFFFSILILFFQNASSDTLHVGSGQEYSSIQDAINSANTSYRDTIYVHSGVYTENLVIDRSVTIIGENKENTVLSGNTTGHVIEITSDNVEISSFTIQNALGTEYVCIFMNKVHYCEIKNNIIKNSYQGIYLLDSHQNIISDNIIKDNYNDGIFASFSDNNIFKSNKIYYNENGINIGSFSDDNEIFDNDLLGKAGIPKGIGVYLAGSTSGNIVYLNRFNDFADNAKDIQAGNFWYNSSIQKGNYWDDYTGADDYHGSNQDIPGGDGIGDTPYDISDDTDSSDMYPLVVVAHIDSISPNPATEGQSISFNGHGTTDGTIVEYEWTANDNKISTQKSFSYSGLTPGTYTIKFRVKDDDGIWSDYDSETLTVKSSSGETSNQKPSATIIIISPKTAEYGKSIYFAGKGTDDGYITEYYWSSNRDGFLSNEQSFYKSDLSIGTHTISFKVKDNDNEWSDPVTSTVTINPASFSQENSPPVARINGPREGYVNETIVFNASNSYDPDENDNIVSYLWGFGDGIQKTGETVEHVYNVTGNFSVTLTVLDSHGEQSTNTTFISIIEKNSNSASSNNTEKHKWVIPGFETFFVILAIIFVGLYRKKSNV